MTEKRRPMTIETTITQMMTWTAFLFCMLSIWWLFESNGRHMASKTDRLTKMIWGTSDAKQVGFDQTLKGLREGRRNDLIIGLAISGIAYLQRTQPKKKRIYKQEVKEGSALVIHNTKSGEQRLEIVKPKKAKR